MQREICIEAINSENNILLSKGKRAVGTIGSHFHCGYALGVIASGEAELTYEDNRIRLSSGMLYLMNPFTIHQIRFLVPSEYYVINIKSELVRALGGNIYLRNMCCQNQNLTQVMIDIYQKLSSNEMGSIQKQMILKYLIEILGNEQELTT